FNLLFSHSAMELIISSTISPFYFNNTAPPEISTLSLHDALPIYVRLAGMAPWTDTALLAEKGIPGVVFGPSGRGLHGREEYVERSEEHTSELQSRFDIVCRLLLEKKNNRQTFLYIIITTIM